MAISSDVSKDVALKKIIEQCSTLRMHEKRSQGSYYCEIVFYAEDMDKWDKTLADLLGTAVKPAGAVPTREDLYVTKDYGTVHDNQVLFKKEFSGFVVAAMFWPWQDRAHVTLKLFLI